MTDNDETPATNFRPTPEVLLRWIAAAGEMPWFPSRFAAENGVPRDALDEPLAQLRNAGLIRVRDWVRGIGQGYSITPDGVDGAANPHRLRQLLASPTPGQVRKPEAPPTTFDRGEDAREALLDPRPSVVVPLLIVANVVWFFVGLVLALKTGRSVNTYLVSGDLGLLQRLGAVSGFDLLRGEWWRVLTSAFVHSGILHLLLNMYAIGTIGSITESIWGRFRFSMLYLASCIGAGCLAMSIHPAAMTSGASGAFWGLMCSLLIWFWMNRRHLPPEIVKRGLRQMGILFLISLVVSFAPGVSWAGHFGGGIVGVTLGSLFVLSNRYRRNRRGLTLAVAVVLIASCVGALVVQSGRSREWLQLRMIDAIQKRAEYVRSIEPAMASIQRGPVEAIYRKTMDVVHLDAKKPDLPAQARQLREAADTFARFVPTQPRPAQVPAELTEKYQNYANAVRDLADAILAQLENPMAELGKLKERKRIVDERRAELSQHEKLEF